MRAIYTTPPARIKWCVCNSVKHGDTLKIATADAL